jgi:hypothetical protein
MQAVFYRVCAICAIVDVRVRPRAQVGTRPPRPGVQLCSTTTSEWPLGSRSQNIGGSAVMLILRPPRNWGLVPPETRCRGQTNRMEQSDKPSERALWRITVAAPVLAGVATWVLAQLTISVGDCQVGGAQGLDGRVLVGLIGVPTLLSFAAGYFTRVRWLRMLTAVLATFVLSVFAVWAGSQVWWVGHGCFT